MKEKNGCYAHVIFSGEEQSMEAYLIRFQDYNFTTSPTKVTILCLMNALFSVSLSLQCKGTKGMEF